MSLQERQSELVDTHRTIQAAGLPYVLVGGWAVSAFQTRFTTDVDMVIPESALERYDTVLEELEYTKEMENEIGTIYEGQIVRYEKTVRGNPVEFDALVETLSCRQTDAEWSYAYLDNHSIETSLEMAADLHAQIPEPALLFALKLHSGRKADARDLVVLGAEANLDNVGRHADRGDLKKLASQIEQIVDTLEEDGFEDSFKGVFQQQELPDGVINDVVETLWTFQKSL